MKMKTAIKKLLTALSSVFAAAFMACTPVIASAAYEDGTRSTVSVSPLRIIVCIGIGLLVAFIVTSVMKSKLRSVHWQNSANDYIDSSSFKLTLAEEIYKYEKTEKTERPRERDSDE